MRQRTLLFAAAITVLVAMFLFKGPLDWDALVYIMNAKNMVNGYVYYEDYRPPMLPLVYSVFFLVSQSEFIPRILSLLFSMATVGALYLLVKKLYNQRIALYSTAFFAFSAGFLIWSNSAYTEIPSLLLTTLSVLAYLRGGKWYAASGVLAASAALMRYTAVYIIVSFLLYEIFIRKLKFMKSYAIFLLAFILSFIPLLYYNWLAFHNPIYPLLENFRLAAGASTAIYEYANIFAALNPVVILASIMYVLRRKLGKPDKTMLILFLPILIFYMLVSHRELRYFLASFPLLTTFAASYLIRNKRILQLLIISGVLMIIYAFGITQLVNQYNDSVKQASLDAMNLNGTIYSNFWPYIAYYSQKDVGTFPWPPERLLQNIEASKVQYFVIQDYPGKEPCYTDASILSNLPFLNRLSSSRINIDVYEVNRAKFNPSDAGKYLSVLRC